MVLTNEKEGISNELNKEKLINQQLLLEN